MQIELNTKIQRKQNVLVTELDGELCMMSIENGKYYGMDPVGSRIWEILENSTTVSALIDTLVSEYEVDPSVCEKHTICYLQKIEKEDLLVFY